MEYKCVRCGTRDPRDGIKFRRLLGLRMCYRCYIRAYRAFQEKFSIPETLYPRIEEALAKTEGGVSK